MQTPKGFLVSNHFRSSPMASIKQIGSGYFYAYQKLLSIHKLLIFSSQVSFSLREEFRAHITNGKTDRLGLP